MLLVRVLTSVVLGKVLCSLTVCWYLGALTLKDVWWKAVWGTENNDRKLRCGSEGYVWGRRISRRTRRLPGTLALRWGSLLRRTRRSGNIRTSLMVVSLRWESSFCSFPACFKLRISQHCHGLVVLHLRARPYRCGRPCRWLLCGRFALVAATVVVLGAPGPCLVVTCML